MYYKSFLCSAIPSFICALSHLVKIPVGHLFFTQQLLHKDLILCFGDRIHKP